MTKFSKDEYLLGNIDKNVEVKSEYKKMLNNLLGISSRDNSTFTSSKIKNIDLFNLLSDDEYIDIFTKEKFKVQILTSKTSEVISDLEGTSNIDEFLSITDSNAINLGITDRKLLEQDFLNNRNDITIKLNQSRNQVIAKWKKLRNTYLDMQTQTNSWPLYIGSMFIKVKTNKTTLYAPLIMKKVMIDITNTNKIYLKSIDESVDINEKLLFLLQNEYKFNLPMLESNESFSIQEVINEFTSALSKIIESDFSFRGKFTFETKKSVFNKDIKYAKGAILTFSQPSGGKLREKMISLINNNKTENLLDIDVLRDLNKEIIDSVKDQEKIFRITQTDISQEKAILGSLKDSAVIWGPPGSGKSQTISNIIANLMYKEKSIIITSEKKAALDVIKDRMGILGKYMFFGLVDKDINKEEFYKPFKELINVVKTSNLLIREKGLPTINNEILSYIKQKDILSNENLESLIELSELSFSAKKFILKNKHIINNSKNIEKMIEGDSLLEIISDLKKNKKVWFKIYPKDIKFIKKYQKKFYGKAKHLSSFKTLENKENILKINNFLDSEINYVNSVKDNEFKNDEKFLDELFSSKFKSKINELRNSEKYKKKVNLFMKNCLSAYRIPYKFINIHKEIIDQLFNVFVSTPQQLSSIIDMDSNYDYAIFDEASQLHLEKAIPFISIANKSIIAGDSQQMRPTSFFMTRDKTESLDNNEENVDSLLDFAYRKGFRDTREYMLTKNYRSHSSELMLFSSKEFYNSELDTIDNLNLVENPIEVNNVNGKWEGRLNEKEALFVLDSALQNLEKYESIIILTLNSNQKKYIESLIYGEIKYAKIISALGSGLLKLRNLENIQGDEADLVIVSISYDYSSKLSSTYVARNEGRNALNVAISRAKKKMIVAKSISSKDVVSSTNNKSINTFKKWLEYLEMSSNDRKNNFIDIESHKKGETFDSGFEEDVYDSLVEELKTSKKNYIKTQFSVGSYKIDISIIDSNTHKFILGIEVDGYKYHSGFEKQLKDIERQKFLESKNYPIYRITELNWKLNYKKEIKKIFTLVEGKQS